MLIIEMGRKNLEVVVQEFEVSLPKQAPDVV